MKVPNDVRALFNIAARSDAQILITGPTGSGKTTLARKIHDESARKNRPFVSINLGTLHEGTLESELFGHEKGAFTSADQRRIGRLESAHGGTVFLDEVAELPIHLQARLLEFLHSRTITPVGGNREIHLDVRVIAATHRHLPSEIVEGRFREDLFHRLRVLHFQMKSLADRADEFDAIVHACLEELCRKPGRRVLRLSEEVASRLESYSWPGNFRELRNVLEYAVLASDGPEILSSDLPAWFFESRNEPRNPGGMWVPALCAREPSAKSGNAAFAGFREAMTSFEKDYLEQMLFKFGGRVNYTARKIGMNKTTLIRRMRAHGLSSGPRF